MNERERRERFLAWWNDPDTNHYMTDFNVDQAFYMWEHIEQRHAERERELVEENRMLKRMREKYDCRFAGDHVEVSGSHCPIEEPCVRCQLEIIGEKQIRRIEESGDG